MPEFRIFEIEIVNLMKKLIPKEQTWTKYGDLLDEKKPIDDYLIVLELNTVCRLNGARWRMSFNYDMD